MAKVMYCDKCYKTLQEESCHRMFATRKKYHSFVGYTSDGEIEFHYCPRCWKEVLAYLRAQQKDMTWIGE